MLGCSATKCRVRSQDLVIRVVQHICWKLWMDAPINFFSAIIPDQLKHIYEIRLVLLLRSFKCDELRRCVSRPNEGGYECTNSSRNDCRTYFETLPAMCLCASYSWNGEVNTVHQNTVMSNPESKWVIVASSFHGKDQTVHRMSSRLHAKTWLICH